jgi:hypothetical protein
MSDSPSFDRVIDHIYKYFKELMMAEYLQETLDQFDDFTPLDQFDFTPLDQFDDFTPLVPHRGGSA